LPPPCPPVSCLLPALRWGNFRPFSWLIPDYLSLYALENDCFLPLVGDRKYTLQSMAFGPTTNCVLVSSLLEFHARLHTPRCTYRRTIRSRERLGLSARRIRSHSKNSGIGDERERFQPYGAPRQLAVMLVKASSPAAFPKERTDGKFSFRRVRSVRNPTSSIDRFSIKYCSRSDIFTFVTPRTIPRGLPSVSKPGS